VAVLLNLSNVKSSSGGKNSDCFIYQNYSKK
jgi:hypothetical protein